MNNNGKSSFLDNKKMVILCGAIIGFIAALLVKLGNPGNMGFCIACFERDIAGALGFHRAGVVQYMRPEIIGLVIGAFLMALFNKEYKSVSGSSPATRFLLSIAVMIGALMFLGCPLRMILRLGGGDMNAIFGLVGFAVGIAIGVFFLNKGFNLKRNYKTSKHDGLILPVIMVILFVFLLVRPAFLFFSEKGPGALAAPIAISLIAGLVVGALAQKSRICMVGGIRDIILFKDNTLLLGFVAVFLFALIGNIAFGQFNFGFEGQPVAHTDAVWNALGMVLVGWGSVLLGGCPLRQLILSGEGNTDSVVSVFGMIVGAAICHNLGLASSPAGPSANGKIAVLVCFGLVLGISLLNSMTSKKA